MAYGADGRTVIATVHRDLKRDNGGGIWVSRDEGGTWEKPATGNIPATVNGLRRTSAHGISYAPDNRNRIYVGSDYGVAISSDNGASWNHHLLEPGGPVAFSIQGLPGNRVIAVSPGAVYLKSAAGDTWSVILRRSFSEGFKNIDVLPHDNEKVLILQNYNSLLLYEVAANSWTEINLPGGLADRRGPFVRASRGVDRQTIDIWVGLGVNLYKASCTDIDCVRRLRCVGRPNLPPEPCDWRQIGRAQGLHDDCGHLGLDREKRPVMYGSDGGLFKPIDLEAVTWTNGSPGGSGMNSYQITSLMGTNYLSQPRPSLYFATQDNGIWASPDGGRTWPNSDCAEGWKIQVWHNATSTTDAAARVAYGSTGCHVGARVSDANLLNQRDATNIPRTGRRVRGTLYEPFVMSPGNWIRFISGRDDLLGSSFLSMSTDNLEHWENVGTTRLNLSSAVFKSGGPVESPTTYTAFAGALIDRSGNPRIALARMRDVLHVRPGERGERDLRYLPVGGNFGVRATEFDWQPVYGVDPRDPNFLIVPDVINQTIWYSTNGGDNWVRDNEMVPYSLTQQVTQSGRFLFSDGLPGQVQVTNISFSPYEPNLIMVGTREAGVIYSENHGETWQTVPDSGGMLYVTNFFFSPDGTVYVSTYGRGLWKIDMGWRRQQFSIDLYCPGDCGTHFRLVRDEPDPKSIRDFAWKDHNVLVVIGGRVNGVIRSGEEVKSVTITPGSSYRFYAVDDQPIPKIIESKRGAGFKNDLLAEHAFKQHAVITAVVLKGGKQSGYLTNKHELRWDQQKLAQKAGQAVPGDKPEPSLPYLSINTDSPIGPGFVQMGGAIRLFGRGFMEGTADLYLDDKVLTQVNVEKQGYFSFTIKVGEEVTMGPHRLKISQTGQKEERKSVATFVKVRGQDRSERNK